MIKLRKRKIKHGGHSLYLDIYNNGQRKTKSLNLFLTRNGVNNKEILRLAESIRAKHELEMNTQEYGFVPASAKNISLLDYYEKLLPNALEKGNKNFKATYAHLKRYEKSNVRLTAINEYWIEGFENYLKGIVCDNSVLTYFNNLKAVLNRAVRDRIIVNNPFIFYRKMKKPDVEKSYLTLDELKTMAITDSDNNEIKKAFLFSCYTGLRLSDVTKLTWSNIKSDRLEFRQKKTKEFEYLPLAPTAKQLLFPEKNSVIGNPEDKVFFIPSQQVVSKILKRMAAKAGINKHVTFHTARHTFATMAITHGVDLYVVSNLLGHTDITHTQIYAKIVDERKNKAMLLLPKIKITF